jgi:CubicO group peptidase (beta-lactamase class C family)
LALVAFVLWSLGALFPAALSGSRSALADSAASPVPGEAEALLVAGPTLTEVLDEILDQKVQSGELVGAVFTLMKDGQVVYSHAVGSRDAEKDIPMTADTPFRLSSVSKIFTVAVAGVLLSRGTIALDDPVSAYLPYFTPKAPAGEGKPILIRHLLNHTAGLDYLFVEKKDGPYHLARVSDGLDSAPGLTLTENVKRIASCPLLYEPGESWKYSQATDVLGEVIAVAYGKPFPEATRELLLEPLGIAGPAFWSADPALVAVQYRLDEPKPRPLREPETFSLGAGLEIVFSPARAFDPHAWPSGGAGLVGTAQDVLKVLEAIRINDGSLMSQEVVTQLSADSIAPLEADAPGLGFGAGWAVVRDSRAAELPLSPGSLVWSGVYGHTWFMDREKGLSGVLMTDMTMSGIRGNAFSRLVEAAYASLFH